MLLFFVAEIFYSLVFFCCCCCVFCSVWHFIDAFEDECDGSDMPITSQTFSYSPLLLSSMPRQVLASVHCCCCWAHVDCLVYMIRNHSSNSSHTKYNNLRTVTWRCASLSLRLQRMCVCSCLYAKIQCRLNDQSRAICIQTKSEGVLEEKVQQFKLRKKKTNKKTSAVVSAYVRSAGGRRQPLVTNQKKRVHCSVEQMWRWLELQERQSEWGINADINVRLS